MTDELFEEDTLAKNVVMETPKEKYEIVFAYFHLATLYGAYLLFTFAKLMTAAVNNRWFINPSKNLGVARVSYGEGWHNYHHVFPWSYKTYQLGNYRFNVTPAFIDFFREDRLGVRSENDIQKLGAEKSENNL